MKFEKSKYSSQLTYHKLEMTFGEFFFCEKFVISELSSDIHFDWPKIKTVLAEIVKFYGRNTKLAYISNRINSYSIDPQDWKKLEDYGDMLVASAVVYYSYTMFMNASIEKLFSNFKIHACLSLDEAITWVGDLKELH